MKLVHGRQTVLVPVFGADISDDTLATARTLLDRPDTRLVLVHVEPPDEAAADRVCPTETPASEPRWHRLASTTAADRTFVEVVCGDPVQEVLDEAERFGSEVIVLGSPEPAGTANGWIDRAIAELVRTAPRRVCLSSQRKRTRRARYGASAMTRRKAANRRFHVH